MQIIKDKLPKEHQYFTYIKKVIRHRCRHAGYRRFTTPIFEDFDIFKKIYELPDDKTQNSFSFTDLNGHKKFLVNDRVPFLVRAYVDNNMKIWAQPVELYFIEPIFTFESQDKYKYAQSDNFGVAVMGETDPAIDAQVIQLFYQILDDLGVSHLVKLKINNAGSLIDQKNYSRALQDFYIGKERSLCSRCNDLLYTKPLQLLNCEQEDCKILSELAPKFAQFISKESKNYIIQVQEYLNEIEVPFEVDEKLFLKEPYYTNIAFEFVGISKVDSKIAEGGRCDNLFKLLKLESEEAIDTFGANMNIDAIIAMMKKEKIQVPSKDNLHLFVAQLGPEAKKKCLRLMKDCREVGIKCVGALGKGSMKEQLQLAQQFTVPYTILMGLTEVNEGVVILRDMIKGVQYKVKYEEAIEEIIKLIGEKNLDKYHPGELVYS